MSIQLSILMIALYFSCPFKLCDKGFPPYTEMELHQNNVAIDIAQPMGFVEKELTFGFAAELCDHHVFLGIGPYPGMALGGTRKRTVTVNAASNQTLYSFIFRAFTDQLVRIDYGERLTWGLYFTVDCF